MVTLKKLPGLAEFCQVVSTDTPPSNGRYLETTPVSNAFVETIRGFAGKWRGLAPIECFAIMPDHIHLLMKIEETPDRLALGKYVYQLEKALAREYWERADGTALAKLRADGTALAELRADGTALARLRGRPDGIGRAKLPRRTRKGKRNMNETGKQRVLHGAAPSAPVLIVSGLGHFDDRCAAAAAALRRYPGAELAFASKAALPDVLANAINGGFAEIHLLGVSLGGDPANLAKALTELKRKRTAIVWHSVYYGLPDSLPESTRKMLEVRFVDDADSLAAWVAHNLGVEAKLPLALLNPNEKGRDIQRWRGRVTAVEWNFANTRDFGPIERLIRDLADGVPPDRWDDATRRLLDAYGRWGNRELESSSPAMRQLRHDIGRVAKSAAMRVLVTGESGTGKETVAQQIHIQSGRRGPFLAFNCATVAKELLESRLFGHRRGAFTGATEARPGLFREADGGTLFLDEVGELPMETQGLLLRALQEGRVQGIGEGEETPVDVRVVAATNRDLPALVREGRFREDLYFRLSLVELRVPPLRERTDDLPAIARSLWKSLAPGRKPLSDVDITALAAFDWPGNVRQLANVLERAALFGDRTVAQLVAEEKYRVAAITESPKGEGKRTEEVGRKKEEGMRHESVKGDPNEDGEASELLDDAIRAHVRRVLERHGGNVTQAALALGISRNTLRARLS